MLASNPLFSQPPFPFPSPSKMCLLNCSSKVNINRYGLEPSKRSYVFMPYSHGCRDSLALFIATPHLMLTRPDPSLNESPEAPIDFAMLWTRSIKLLFFAIDLAAASTELKASCTKIPNLKQPLPLITLGTWRESARMYLWYIFIVNQASTL